MTIRAGREEESHSPIGNARFRPAMKIGILGAGGVAQSLGKGFAANGHDVKLSSRTPGKKEVRSWLQATKGTVSAGTFAEAAAHGEVVVLATLGAAAESVLDAAGAANLSGKVLVDVTNPLDFSKGMPPGLFVGTTDSLGERIQRKVPRAKVVKTLNIVNQDTMIRPRMKEGVPDMFLAGNDGAAKAAVGKLLKEFGWGEPVDLGRIEEARWLEALVPLWVRVALKLGSWHVAFRVLRT